MCDESDAQGEKCLAVTLIRIHDMEVYAVMDFGATPNVLSPQLAKQLVLKAVETNKMVKVANENRLIVV